MQRICDNNVNGTYEYCWTLALFGDISDLNPGVSTVVFYIMNTIEVLVLILLFCAVPVVLPVLWRSNTFHLNMMRFLVFFVAHSYIYLTSRAVLFLFQNGIVKIANETGNPLDYVLIGATVGRWYQLASCIFILAAIVVERGCATLYIADYEKQRRSRISFLLILAVMGFSLLQGYSITFSVNTILHHLLLVNTMMIAVCSAILCVWIYFYNERRLRRLKNASDKYTLSLKFQLIENIRSFRFIRNAVMLGTTGAIIVVTPFAVGIIYRPILNVRVIAGQTFEMLNAIFFTGAVIGLPFLTPSWLHEVMKRTRLSRYFGRAPSPRVRPLKKDESDTYFDDLHSLWNTRLDAKMNSKNNS